MRLTRVKQVMTPFPYTIAWEASVSTAVQMMQEHDIRHLPVTQGEQVVGVVSDADLRVSQALKHHSGEQAETPVGLVCTRNPYLVDLETAVVVAAEEMVSRQIGSALVTRQGQLCGILSATDLLELLCDRLRKAEPPAPDDLVS